MALDNYPNLRQAIKQWSHREDIDEFSAQCIEMTEQELFYGLSPMRVAEMVEEVVSSHSTKEISFPDDMLELISFSIEVDDIYYQLKPVTTTNLIDNDKTGTPCFYSITSQFELDTTPDKAYNFKFIYYKKPTALSDDNPTNIILTKYPNTYFFGGLSAAFMYAGEEDKANQYAIRMRDVVNTANANANNLMFGADPVQIIQGGAP